MKTYRSVKRRMQSRFMKNGILQAKLFLVSSKKSEQDFIESYVETVKSEPTVMVVDKAQWEIKPEGTFSKHRFKVAVGDRKVHSRIVQDGEDLDALAKQGYRIIDVPLELKKDFERDVDSSLMEFAGISASLATKFISYDNLVASYKSKTNPFTNNIISLGTNDDLLIQDFFKPDMIADEFKSKPLFIHIDGSLTGDRTGISGVWVIGLRETKDYDTNTGEFIPVQELVYKHAFSIGIQCPAGAEISLEKNRKFIYYLKYSLGYNVKGVTLDGYQSADSKQQFIQAGFDASILSLDRSPDGYLYLKASINECRIAMIEIPQLEDELLDIERNNSTGKIDHTKSGSKDIADSLAGALFNASRNTDMTDLYVVEDFTSMSSVNEMQTDANYRQRVIDNLSQTIQKEDNNEPSLKEVLSGALADLKLQSDNSIDTRINKMKSNLSREDRNFVTDDELENAFINKGNDNMLIW